MTGIRVDERAEFRLSVGLVTGIRVDERAELRLYIGAREMSNLSRTCRLYTSGTSPPRYDRASFTSRRRWVEIDHDSTRRRNPKEIPSNERQGPGKMGGHELRTFALRFPGLGDRCRWWKASPLPQRWQTNEPLRGKGTPSTGLGLLKILELLGPRLIPGEDDEGCGDDEHV